MYDFFDSWLPLLSFVSLDKNELWDYCTNMLNIVTNEILYLSKIQIWHLTYQFNSITELQNYLYHFHNLAPKNAQPQNSDDYFSYLTDFSYFSLEEKILKVKDTIRTGEKMSF